MDFHQSPPQLGNQYRDDRALRRLLERILPDDVRRAVEPQLDHLGALAAGPLLELAHAHRFDEPRHVPFDAWGRRVDRVEVSAAWREFARVAAREGVVATAYERAHGAWSRVHQFALMYLFDRSTQVYTCPLAMTDGCARTLELLAPPALRDRVLPRLVSRDPDAMWTSGQWMTERTGGSDVGRSESVARLVDGRWRLWGTKWFTSAVTSQVALTLARPEGNGPGGKGLALFFVELRDDAGALRGVRVERLKEKLGTRLLPTAELTLEGMPAVPLSGTGDGVRHMATMLNVTRTWNAVSSASSLRRGLALARDYARRRVAFGAPLAEKPLHRETLADLAAEHAAALQLAFFAVSLLGRDELGELDASEQALLRLVQPVAKLTTARQAVAGASEVLEAFGGAGYVEDTGLPELLRDAQVLSIWEGTTNVLALESLRAALRADALPPFAEAVREHAAAARDPRLAEPARAAREAVARAECWYAETAGADPESLEAGARRFALTLGGSLSLALLVAQAQWDLDRHEDDRAGEAARRLAPEVDRLWRASPDPAATTRLALDEGFPPSVRPGADRSK